ncbi:MAG: chorismate synthase [Spirochaetaceae bacterium]|jgi:chorismate synthase|nr:chorismate synthase [Spirochaetaceae bacterium]
MAGNSFGTLFRVSTFGESHGPALGCVVDGCPAGIPLSVDDIRRDLRRRRPGHSPGSTTRQEGDEPEILSGVYEGKTLGTPIAILIRNRDQHSGDYEGLKDLYRPGHADWTWELKYGLRDPRGGGRSSGRETAGRVAAGAIARTFLARDGIVIQAWTASIGGIHAPVPGEEGFSLTEAEQNSLRVPGKKAAERIEALLGDLQKAEDSAGGLVSCRISGLPPGLGEPVFDKLSAILGRAILSIGACKGIQFGAGFAAAGSTGSAHNDTPVRGTGRPRAATGEAGPLLPGEAAVSPGPPDLSFKTNNAGGTLGGISTGMDVEFQAAFKPVASISRIQRTVDRYGAEQELSVPGRHDVCIVPRVVPVVEAMAALVLADLALRHRAAKV